MLKIGLLGHGVVGSGVAKIVDDGATWETRELEISRILVKSEAEMTDSRMTLNADEILDDPEISVICECMGGLEPAHTFVMKALNNGKHVVTSNKKMLAAYCGEMIDAAKANHVTLHYEASCGGGIPWMASLDRTRRVDDVTSFAGIFNGTTNYILDRMEKGGWEFDVVLKKAQELGYSERDPSEDIDGIDVRYKVALSCLKAFDAVVDPVQIPTYGIRHITAEDLRFAGMHDCSCKLIGSAAVFDDHIEATVIPTFVPHENIFASIPLNFNIIQSRSRTLDEASFLGQGAGSLPTAHAVVQNLVDIYKDQDSEINDKTRKTVDNSARCGIFYIRTANPAVFAGCTKHKLSENVLITEPLSFVALGQLIQAAADEKLFAAEVIQ